MATETMKRKQTLSILDKLRAEGVPPAGSAAAESRYTDEWTGEELAPSSEEESKQDDFEAQKAVRTEQSQINTMPAGVLKDSMGVAGDVAAGPTGMSPLTAPVGTAGMVPYSPAEFERREKFSATDKLRRPGKKKAERE